MPTILLRLLLVCNVVNSIIAYLLPKKLRSFLTSYYPCPSSATAAGGQQQPLPTATVSRGGLTRTLSSPAAADASDLDRVFRMFDRNGDGKITRVELTDSLEDLGIFIPERDLKAVIDRVDADGDGCVDAREFRELYEEIMGEKCGEGEREDDEEDMRDVFHVFDGNGDGYITVEELQSVLESLGILQGKSADDCRTMIRNVDVDGDGRVDYDEFKKMMRRGGVCAVAS